MNSLHKTLMLSVLVGLTAAPVCTTASSHGNVISYNDVVSLLQNVRDKNPHATEQELAHEVVKKLHLRNVKGSSLAELEELSIDTSDAATVRLGTLFACVFGPRVSSKGLLNYHRAPFKVHGFRHFPPFCGRHADVLTINLNDQKITELPDSAFSKFPNLVTLKINHNQITELGANTFTSCKAKNIDLSSNLIDTIEKKAFKPATKLQTLNLASNHLTVISSGMFEGAAALTTLDLSENDIKTIEAGAFKGCTSLTTIDFSGNDTTLVLNQLKAASFTEATALTTLNFGDIDATNANYATTFKPAMVAAHPGIVITP